MTTLLPNAKQQFFSAGGAPLAGGSVYFYIPGTTTFKTTWQDGSQIAANTNPVVLDSAGEAVIFGLGTYRQIVFDALGNQIWDQLTASTDAGGIYSGGTSTGTAANQIVASTTPAGFSLTSGNQLTFIAGFTSTGATTLNANGTGAKAITKPGASGPVAIGIGDIVVGDAVVVYYDGTQFQLINPVALPLTGGTLSGPLNFAQGADIASAATVNLTTATGNVVDVTGATTITAITLQQGATRWVRFTGILTLTNGASLVLPGAANIVTAAGDCALFVGYAAGVVRCETYQRISGLPVLGNNLTAGTQCVQSPLTATVTTQAHGLGVKPQIVDACLECLSAELGYSIGDQVPIGATTAGTEIVMFSRDATNIKILTSSTTYPINRKDTGAAANITAANWKVVVTPYRLN